MEAEGNEIAVVDYVCLLTCAWLTLLLAEDVDGVIVGVVVVVGIETRCALFVRF